jgi:hypothetical protein
MEASMADQATSVGGRSSIGPHPETPAAGAPASANAPAGEASAAGAGALPATTQQATGEQEAAVDPAGAGFGERGRMRRRLRFLRKARELAYRDLGGLVFEMQRLGERRDELVAAKLATLAAIDTELRALEDALGDRRPLTILRESGIAACPRCAAIHGSEDRFCPSCGLAMESRADRPIAAVAPPARPPAAAGFPGARFPGAAPAASGGLLGARPTTATAPVTTASPTTPPPTAQPAPPPPSTAPPPSAPPAPAAPPASAAPPAPAAPAPGPLTDERPTEIIRPADESGGEKT